MLQVIPWIYQIHVRVYLFRFWDIPGPGLLGYCPICGLNRSGISMIHLVTQHWYLGYPTPGLNRFKIPQFIFVLMRQVWDKHGISVQTLLSSMSGHFAAFAPARLNRRPRQSAWSAVRQSSVSTESSPRLGLPPQTAKLVLLGGSQSVGCMASGARHRANITTCLQGYILWVLLGERIWRPQYPEKQGLVLYKHGISHVLMINFHV